MPSTLIDGAAVPKKKKGPEMDTTGSISGTFLFHGTFFLAKGPKRTHHQKVLLKHNKRRVLPDKGVKRKASKQASKKKKKKKREKKKRDKRDQACSSFLKRFEFLLIPITTNMNGDGGREKTLYQRKGR